LWEGGLGIPGGLVAGIAAGAYQARRRGIAPTVAMTFAAPSIALAQAIGRWGNWFNQELFGRATDLPWALEIDDEHLPSGFESGTTFHPTFLYESLWNLALCVLLLRIQRQLRLGPGRLLAVYAIGYGIGRFWIEGLRIDPASDVGGLRWNQWVPSRRSSWASSRSCSRAVAGGTCRRAAISAVMPGRRWCSTATASRCTPSRPTPRAAPVTAPVVMAAVVGATATDRHLGGRVTPRYRTGRSVSSSS
jgi:hypothetical protein